MRQRRSVQQFRRQGFALGVCGGVVWVAYKILKQPGSIDRRDALLCFALVLAIGLVGGLIGMALGKIFASTDRDK